MLVKKLFQWFMAIVLIGSVTPFLTAVQAPEELFEQEGFEEVRERREGVIRQRAFDAFFDGLLNEGNVVDRRQAYRHVRHGARVMFKLLLRGERPQYPDLEKYKEDVVGLCWFLTSLAVAKDEAHSEGMFVFLPPNHAAVDRVYNFLLGYVKERNPQGWNVTGLNEYGRRASSHKFDQAATPPTYGVDLLNEAGYGLLPGGKRHFFFTKINGQIALKMENYGVAGVYDTAGHGLEFVFAQTRKRVPGADLFLGSDDAPEYRKEHPPKELLSRINAALKEVGADPIKNIRSFFGEWQFQTNLRENSGVARAIRYTDAQYDYLKRRYGREIQLDREFASVVSVAALSDAGISSEHSREIASACDLFFEVNNLVRKLKQSTYNKDEEAETFAGLPALQLIYADIRKVGTLFAAVDLDSMKRYSVSVYNFFRLCQLQMRDLLKLDNAELARELSTVGMPFEDMLLNYQV